jgi:hypothetical protein
MKEINLKDATYLIFYPEQDMDESSKELMRAFVDKIFGKNSKIYFRDDEDVEIFIKPKKGEKEVKTPNIVTAPESDPNAPVELDPIVAKRIEQRKLRSKASGFPDGALAPDGSFAP